jgi:UDP-2,3-diacylglucosamine pyrophosphatase LpxH
MADGYGSLPTGLPTSLPMGHMRVRALFISDLHLGTRFCQAEPLLDLLRCCEADLIYLVGDVVDGWRLKARWHWPRSHDDIVRCLLRKQQDDSRIVYIPGNHDEFLRHSIGLQLGGIEVADHAIHVGADGQRYLVVHGDQFDPAMGRMRRLAGLGIWVYAAAVLAHDAVTGWRRRHGRGSARRAAHIAAFERALAGEARRLQMHGVICGHIHRAVMHNRLGVHYVNTGDWVESCTAVVEHPDGRFELLRWPADAPVGIGLGGPVGVSIGIPEGVSVRAGLTREPAISVVGPPLHAPAWPEAVRQF